MLRTIFIVVFISHITESLFFNWQYSQMAQSSKEKNDKIELYPQPLASYHPGFLPSGNRRCQFLQILVGYFIPVLSNGAII